MGKVYLAEDPVIGRKVAIKVVTAEPGLPPAELAELQARFEREFQSAGTLSHPNIVTVYDVGKEGEDTFIAMEFLPGESWGDILKSSRKLSYAEVADFAAKICSGLDHAHERGIVHRDIKPANILVARNGEPKITDFGVVKLTSTNLTRTGTIIGTPSYMSPEQITGGAISGASDQFAIGVILYQVLTDQLPFVGENPTTILYKIVHDTPPPPCATKSELPAEIDKVLMRALEKDPKDRYGSCTELADSLRQALGLAVATIDFDLDHTENVRGRQAGGRKKKTKPSRGRGLRTALAGGLVVVLAAGMYYYRDLWWPRVAEIVGLAAVETAPVEPIEADSQTVSHPFTVIGETDGAVIWIDGEDTGLLTPATVTLEGTIGNEVMLELQRDGQTVARTSMLLTEQMPPEWRAIEEVPPETFVVTSNPRGAQVFLNDELIVGSTPTEIELLPGEAYDLRIELAEYYPQSRSFAFPEELDTRIRQSSRFSFSLKPKIPPGRIVIEAPYPVAVSIAGQKFEATLLRDISLKPGNHEIRLTAPDVFLDESRFVPVASNEVINLDAPPAIELTFTAHPSNCQVFVNGRFISETPFRKAMVPGSYEFRFLWPDRGEKTVIKRVTRTGEKEIFETLQ